MSSRVPIENREKERGPDESGIALCGYKRELNMKQIFPFLMLLMFMGSGCKPTYPKTKVSDSIIKLCRDDYNTEVKVKTIGKTMGVHMPMDNLLDSSLQPS